MNITPIARMALLSAIVVAPAGAWGNSYTIVDLGANDIPTGIDSKGEISGVLLIDGKAQHSVTRAIVFSGGKWHREPTGQARSSALAVSHRMVVGYIKDQPTAWLHRGAPVTIPLPGSGTVGTPAAVNSSGDVVGYFQVHNDVQHCFLWSSSTGVSQDLGALEKDGDCVARGVDNRGYVFGQSARVDGSGLDAFVWQKGQMRRLHSLSNGGSSDAFAGNDVGDIVGESAVKIEKQPYVHAVSWHDGIIHDLTPDAGYAISHAYAVNDAGTIVGTAEVDRASHAFRFGADGPVDLNAEVTGREDWTLQNANGVSPTGIIIGVGSRSDGLTHGFMLIPQ